MIPARTAIFVATERFDLRRSFDGLAGIVKEILHQDPLLGALFIFFNKAAESIWSVARSQHICALLVQRWCAWENP